MSESSSLITKAFETETGKFISSKLFGKLETTLKSNSNQREANEVLDSIAPVNSFMEQQIFEKVTDRYLTFRTLLSRDNDVFIDEIYHPLKIVSMRSNTEIITLAENTEFTFPKIACIVGKAGQGKTTILRKMFLNHITSSVSSFPLIITLRKVDWKDRTLTPPKIISNEFNDLGITVSEEACAYLLQLGRIKVFFDGFDEIESNYREFALATISQTHMKYGAKCVVTTRPGTEVQLFGGEIQNYTLLDLDKEDVIKIINKHSLIKKTDKKQLLNVIDSKPDIASILLTPIIVDIFISTYNSLVAEPTTIIDFYEELFQTLASSHDRLKVLFDRKGVTGLTNKQLEKVFWTASFKLLNKRNDINFRETEVSEAFDFAASKLGYEANNSHVDVINKTSLIKQDGLEYSYLHKSIAEFHAAKHIKSLSDDTRKEYYKSIIYNYRVSHENVLRYLSKLDEDLFYISFVDSLIAEISKQSSIFNDGKNNIFTSDTLLVCTGYDSFIVTKDVDKQSISVKVDRRLDRSEDKLKGYFLMLSSILDVRPPTVSEQNLLESTTKEIMEHNTLINREPNEKKFDKAGNLLYVEYYFKFSDVIDLDNTILLGIERVDLSAFYLELEELKNEVKKRQKVYDQKNTLNQFY
ncbi:NACHT domain-containing protein [Vibrio cidicii]|nr:NACHT domain-containing protein [Vibrio cidicii]